MKLALLIVFFFAKAVAAGPKQCNFCLGPNEASCWENQETDLQCDTAPDSIGITHCATAVGKYRDDKSGNISDFFIRGCVDCANKKDACFTFGGWLKVQKRWTVLQCEIECCTDDNCNTQLPQLSQDAVTVFTPNVHGPAHCNGCQGDDATECGSVLKNQVCASDILSLGTTHCGSAVIQFRKGSGWVASRFLRGCVNCEDKQAACAAIRGLMKDQPKKMLQCEVECCTENNCNTQIPTLPPKGGAVTTPTAISASPRGHLPFLSRAFAFAVAFGNIVYHF